jgi:uncharacterized glyoxalase superfamily protein PhnB
MSTATNLYPRLIVADADAAIDFYRHALGASLLERFVDREGRVVHAALDIGGSILSVAQSVPEWGLLDPLTLGSIAARLTESQSLGILLAVRV